MKTSLLFVVAAAAGLLAVSSSHLFADDASKEVTISGTMVCGKCTLHLTKECQNVVQVTQGTNTVNYFLENNEVSKAAHDPICDPGNSEKVTVTGTITETNGMETMTPTKIVVNKN